MIKSCQITESINSYEEKNNNNKSEKILNSFRYVSIIKNPILDAIIKVKNKWLLSPIIWIGNFPYKIKIILNNHKEVILYQLCLQILYKTNGKEYYNIINKRKVKIIFE